MTNRFVLKSIVCVLVAGTVLFSCENNNDNNEKNKLDKEKSSQDSIANLKDSLKFNEKEKLLCAFFDSLHNQDLFNGNVLVSQKGQIIFRQKYGYANYSKGDSLSFKSSFQLASMSKQFTAVSVMMLVERGKLNFSDSIQQFFPDFPYHNITIHLLLSHRSGLPNYIYFLDKLMKNSAEKSISGRMLIDSLTKYKPARYYPPDKKFNYSNTGYAILAAIVEKVSGMAFSDFLQKEIFDPLEMDDTFIYNINKSDGIPYMATGYLYQWKEATDNFADGVLGDKGIYSTVDDLFKWEMGLFNYKLVNKKSLDVAFTPQSKEKKGPRNYGYGWRLKTMSDSTTMIFHGGWWHGFYNLLIHMPDNQTSIIILRNRKNKHIIAPQELFDILLPGNAYACETDSLNDE